MNDCYATCALVVYYQTFYLQILKSADLRTLKASMHTYLFLSSTFYFLFPLGRGDSFFLDAGEQQTR